MLTEYKYFTFIIDYELHLMVFSFSLDSANPRKADVLDVDWTIFYSSKHIHVIAELKAQLLTHVGTTVQIYILDSGWAWKWHLKRSYGIS